MSGGRLNAVESSSIMDDRRVRGSSGSGDEVLRKGLIFKRMGLRRSHDGKRAWPSFDHCRFEDTFPQIALESEASGSLPDISIDWFLAVLSFASVRG